MAGKVLIGLFAVVAYSSAASIAGGASIDPSQASIGGRITFPRIPGINSPLFSFGHSNSNSSQNSTNNNNNSIFSPLGQFLRLIPGLNLLLPSNNNNNNNQLPRFPSIEDFISGIPGLSELENGNRSTNFTIPIFRLPSVNDGLYIPGLSEALDEAREHLKAALNVTADLSTGIRDAVQAALESDDPANGIRILMSTISRVYSTVAAHCPLISVGGRVVNEGIRLCGEIAKSVGNVIAGDGSGGAGASGGIGFGIGFGG